MILFLHIAIALSSIILSGLAYTRPSWKIMRASYSLIAATLASGTLLAVLDPAHLPTACLSGLVYLAFTATVTLRARAKLVAEEIHNS